MRIHKSGIGNAVNYTFMNTNECMKKLKRLFYVAQNFVPLSSMQYVSNWVSDSKPSVMGYNRLLNTGRTWSNAIKLGEFKCVKKAWEDPAEIHRRRDPAEIHRKLSPIIFTQIKFPLLILSEQH